MLEITSTDPCAQVSTEIVHLNKSSESSKDKLQILDKPKMAFHDHWTTCGRARHNYPSYEGHNRIR